MSKQEFIIISFLFLLFSCDRKSADQEKTIILEPSAIMATDDSLFFQGHIISVCAKDSSNNDGIVYTEIIATLHKEADYANTAIRYRVLDHTTNWQCLLSRLKCDESISLRNAVFDSIETVRVSDKLKIPAGSSYSAVPLPTIKAKVSLISTDDFGYRSFDGCTCR